MACFTAEHVIPLGLATARRTCQIGDNIWIIQDVGGEDYEIWKLDTKTKHYEKVEYTNINNNPMEFSTEYALFGNRHFIVSTTNDKIYMWRRKKDDHRGSRILEFNTSTLELKHLTNVQHEFYEISSRDLEFLVNGDLIVTIIEGNRLKVINMNTRVVRNRFRFQDEYKYATNYTVVYKGCVLNGSIYLVNTAFPAMRAVFRYDPDNSKFILFSNITEVSWAKSRVTSDFEAVSSSVWSRHNHIYQAFNCSNEMIVIDCFNVQKEQWNTVFQYKFETHLLSICNTDCFGIICSNDKYIYVISDHNMELAIREFDQYPNLQAICLYDLAVAEAAKIEDFKPSSIELPEQLRRRFANILACKTREKGLGQLEYHMNMIAKLEVEKEQLAIRANGDPDMRSRFATIYDFWVVIQDEQCNHELKFQHLREEFKEDLKQRKRKTNIVEVQQNIDAQSSKFEELVQRYQTDLRPRMAVSNDYESLIKKYHREN